MTEDQKALWAALAAPFVNGEVRQRKIGGGGMADYVTAETVANRLDSVLGVGGWRDSYRIEKVRVADKEIDVIVCRIEVRVPDPEGDYWVAREDAGTTREMSDRGEINEEAGAKAGFSDGFKRAGAKLGIARYIAGEGVPDYAETSFRSAGIQPRPVRDRGPAGPPDGHQSGSRSSHVGGDGTPRTGGALFAWVKKQEQELGWDFGSFVNYLQGWGSERDFPERLVDWNAEQVAAGYREGKEAVSRAQETTPAG